MLDWRDFLPVACGLLVLLVGLWGHGWRRRALAAEAAMADGDNLAYDLLQEIARRTQAMQERAAEQSIRQSLEVE